MKLLWLEKYLGVGHERFRLACLQACREEIEHQPLCKARRFCGGLQFVWIMLCMRSRGTRGHCCAGRPFVTRSKWWRRRPAQRELYILWVNRSSCHCCVIDGARTLKRYSTLLNPISTLQDIICCSRYVRDYEKVLIGLS